MSKKTFKTIGLVLLVLLGMLFIFAKVKRITPLVFGHKEVNKPLFSDTAINGYDPVEYHINGRAQEGDANITYEWKDATWSFVSQENRSIFIANPDKFIPAYGGFCAFAVSKGFTANTNPNSFEVIDGKLYLFDGEEVKLEWLGNQKENLQKGNANWQH